jgi:hypothetical protein
MQLFLWQASTPPTATTVQRSTITRHCVGCHWQQLDLLPCIVDVIVAQWVAWVFTTACVYASCDCLHPCDVTDHQTTLWLFVMLLPVMTQCDHLPLARSSRSVSDGHCLHPSQVQQSMLAVRFGVCHDTQDLMQHAVRQWLLCTAAMIWLLYNTSSFF